MQNKTELWKVLISTFRKAERISRSQNTIIKWEIVSRVIIKREIIREEKKRNFKKKQKNRETYENIFVNFQK